MMFPRFSTPKNLSFFQVNPILVCFILCEMFCGASYGAFSSDAKAGSSLTKNDQVSIHKKVQTKFKQPATSYFPDPVKDIVIVDGNVTHSDTLLKNLPRQTAVHFLSPQADGVDQISDILSNYRNLNSVHLISHGESAQLHLGNSRVTSATLNHKAGQVQQWQAALSPTADIFLYGCNLVATDQGQTFVSRLATLTGADIAASDNLTGDANQGGDWTLEYQLGDLEPQIISQQLAQSNYAQLLQVTVLNFNDPTPTLEPATTNVFRFQNVATVGGQSLDALVTVSNINNATLTNLDDNGSFPERFQPVIRHDGGANAVSSIRFDFQLVQAGTTTPLAATNVFFSAQDVDGNGAANSVREFVEVINADTVFINNPTFLQLATSLAGGIRHRVINSSNVQGGIGTDDRYEIYSYLGDTVTNFSIVAGNDVGSANCSGASCPRQNSWTFDISDIQVIDFSDAPSSYGTPSHAGTTTTTLRLGTARDGDSGPIPSANALGDDNNGSDDEDGVTLATLNASATSYTLQASSLSVTNSTGGPATLHAWVDFDGNGTFEPDEYTSQTVQSGSSSPDGALTWSGAGVSDLSGGTTTYARFRLTTDSDINANTPGGFASDGEVEDYALAINTPSIPPPVTGPGDGNACLLTHHTNSGVVANPNSFYEITDHTNPATLSLIGPWNVPGGTVEGLSANVSTGTVYALNANRSGALYLGIIDPATGSFTDITTTGMTTLSHSTHGTLNVVQTRSLAHQPGTNIIWAAAYDTQPTTGPGNNFYYLFKIDAISGAAITDAFGLGNDYLAIDLSPYETVRATQSATIEALTFYQGNPNFLYGVVSTDRGGRSTNIGHLFTVDVTAANPTATLAPQNLSGTAITGGNAPVSTIYDIEGMSFDENNDLVIVSSNVGGANANSIFFINTSTGAAFGKRSIISGDWEGIVCNTPSPAANNPNVLLVKRITAINGSTNNGGIDLTAYDPDAGFPYDDNVLEPTANPADTDKWPMTVDETSSTFLKGTRDAGLIKPDDTVEYTIYFLSTGNKTAVDVQFCDKVPSFQTFIPDAFNAIPPAPSGGVGANRGISVEYNGSVLSYTNDADGDTAQYYPPGSTLPAVCDNAPAQLEDNGAIVVNLGDLPQATSSGTPTTSYGAVRFRAKVK